MEETRVATRAAEKAGIFLAKHFKKLHVVSEKSPREFVTEADKEAEKIIIEYLKKKYPDYAILSEESGASGEGRYRWVIDPLDGTINYMLGIPFFDVAISLVLKDKPLISVVYAPITNDMYVSELFQGAKLNGKRIHVSEQSSIEHAISTFCHSTTPKEINRNIEIYSKMKKISAVFNQPRAGNLEMAMIASGKLDAFMNNGAKTWDTVCGALLIREAGGIVTDFQGSQWTMKSKDVLATNRYLHNKIIATIKDV
ncbi:MAG: inositol monophosphatase family protein [Candidatus Aenigmatarchaeota archaeon]